MSSSFLQHAFADLVFKIFVRTLATTRSSITHAASNREHRDGQWCVSSSNAVASCGACTVAIKADLAYIFVCFAELPTSQRRKLASPTNRDAEHAFVQTHVSGTLHAIRTNVYDLDALLPRAFSEIMLTRAVCLDRLRGQDSARTSSFESRRYARQRYDRLLSAARPRLSPCF